MNIHEGAQVLLLCLISLGIVLLAPILMTYYLAAREKPEPEQWFILKDEEKENSDGQQQ